MQPGENKPCCVHCLGAEEPCLTSGLFLKFFYFHVLARRPCVHISQPVIFLGVRFRELTLSFCCLFVSFFFFPSLFLSAFPSRYGRLILGYRCRTMAAA